MAERSSHQEFADRLLKQETRVSEAQVAEYRRTLEWRLAKAASREKRLRRVTIALLVVVLMGFLAPLGARVLPVELPSLQELSLRLPAVVFAIFAAVVLAFPICLGLFLLLYFLHYRPKLQQIRHEQVLTIIQELQRQIVELRERDQPKK